MTHEHRPSTAAATRCARALAHAMRSVLLALALTMLATGCTSFYQVDIHGEKGLAVVEPGDTVRLVTTSGAQHVFEVTNATPQQISGDGAHYSAGEVRALERSEHDTAKSVGLTAGIAATTYVVIIVVSIIAVGVVLG